MKIAFLSFYSGEISRGLETYVAELAERLAGRHEVDVYQAGSHILNDKKYRQRVISLPIDWLKVDVHLDGRSDLNLLRRFYLNYWSFKIKDFTRRAFSEMPTDTDIIIAVNCGWQSLLSKIWAVKNHKKLIIPGQSGPGWDDRINLLIHPDVFVALTSFQEQWAKRNSFGTKVVKIYNGVDHSKFNPDVKPIKLDLPHPIILCAAALEKNKRVEETIRAVSGMGGSLVVLGHGDLQQNLEQLGQKYLPGRFMIRSVKHEEIPPYFAACDLFTMVPISQESFGIVYVEAMASGKPVVATNDPIRREIVGEAGVFVDPGNIDQYSQALKDTSEKKWGNIPFLQAKKFSWDAIADDYMNLLNSLNFK